MTTDLAALDGWLAADEGDRLAALAAEVPAGQVIVELGSYRGKSACFLAAGSLAGNHVPVYCVDLWALGGQWETDVARRSGGPLHHDDPAHHEAFRENTAPYRDVIVEIQGHTQKVGRGWDRGPVGLLFVDADHRHDATLADLIAWAPHVAPGGWVVCHDYLNDDYPGVRSAVHKWFSTAAVRSASTTGSMIEVQVCGT